MSYDFQALKLIPVASVLSHYKVQVRKRGEKEFVCKCPLPSHRETEHKHNGNETFCIGLEKNKWYCQSDTCRAVGNHPKGGDVLDLVCRLEHCDVKSAAKKLAELFAVGNTPHPPSKESSNAPLAFELKNLDPNHPYIAGKGIAVETAIIFGIGYQAKGSMADRICFPLMENNSLIGYAGRTVLPVLETNPKWKLPLGLQRTFLYNLERCEPSKPLYLMESAWGCLWLHQHGYQAAALIGTTLTDAQLTLLEPYAEIRIAMDNDLAGREAAEKIAAKLKPTHKVTKAFLNE